MYFINVLIWHNIALYSESVSVAKTFDERYQKNNCFQIKFLKCAYKFPRYRGWIKTLISSFQCFIKVKKQQNCINIPDFFLLSFSIYKVLKWIWVQRQVVSAGLQPFKYAGGRKKPLPLPQLRIRLVQVFLENRKLNYLLQT